MRSVALPNFVIFLYDKQKVKKFLFLAEEILGMTGMRAADGGFIRSHYTVETDYLNNNLVQYVQKTVPGWKMVALPKAFIAPSNFPNVDNQNSLNCAIQSLHQLLCLPISKCKDMISGHCETCGCIVTEAVMAVIQNGDTPVLDIAYGTLAKILKKIKYSKTNQNHVRAGITCCTISSVASIHNVVAFIQPGREPDEGNHG